MTRKEQVLENLRKILNEIGYDQDKINYKISCSSKERISDIEASIEYYARYLKSKLAIAERDAYFATEEGAAKLAQAKEDIENINDKYDKIIEERLNYANELFAKELPNIAPFKVASIFKDSINLEDESSSNPSFLRIEIRTETDWENYSIKTTYLNVASVGATDIIEDSDSRRYYIAIGNLFSAGEIVKNIMDKIFAFKADEIAKIQDNARKLNKFIKDPFDTKAI